MKTLLVLTLALVVQSAYADWEYDASIEKMTGKKNATATITSDNQLSFGFPYAGSNFGFLLVRQHPQYGLDVVVSIGKGQMLCSSYGGCPVKVKFDNAPPVTFSGNGPADHSSTSIFLDNPQRFIAAAKKAKKILVQFNAYQNGAPVLEFSSPSSLQWPPK